MAAYPDESRPSGSGIDAVGSKGYEYPLLDTAGVAVTQNLTSSASTPWIITPRGVQSIVVIADFTGANTVAVEVTCNRVDEILAGTAVAFSLGNVTASTKYELQPVSAVRLTKSAGAGSCKIHYRAQ